MPDTSLHEVCPARAVPPFDGPSNTLTPCVAGTLVVTSLDHHACPYVVSPSIIVIPLHPTHTSSQPVQRAPMSSNAIADRDRLIADLLGKVPPPLKPRSEKEAFRASYASSLVTGVAKKTLPPAPRHPASKLEAASATTSHTASLAHYKELVALLRQAAMTEHSLMCSYLYAACIIKTLPCELADPVRGAAQFETARTTKASLLRVAVEEMLHLHYVNCLLRALGERHEFGLPPRDKAGAFLFPDWHIHVDGACDKGTRVPLQKCTAEQLDRFVVYEATDGVQAWPSDKRHDCAVRIHQWETLLHCAQTTRITSVDGQGNTTVTSPDNIDEPLTMALYGLYAGEAPPPAGAAQSSLAPAVCAPPDAAFHFQSIGDLYMQEILPRYRMAHAHGWMVVNNKDFANELQYDSVDGRLPFNLTTNRAKRYQEQHDANVTTLMHYEGMIQEIVEQGEGFQDVDTKVTDFLATFPVSMAGVRAYLTAAGDGLSPNQRACPMSPKHKQTAPSKALETGSATDLPLADFGELRMSHLYSHARSYGFVANETRLNPTFACHRADLPVHDDCPTLATLRGAIARQFNVVFMIMRMWLGRMYDTDDWYADESRRRTIENVATWPLMSLGIRPLLEIAAMFGAAEGAQLFRVGRDDCADQYLPSDNQEALALHRSIYAPLHTQEHNKYCDQLALLALTTQRRWVRTMASGISALPPTALPQPYRDVIIQNLQSVDAVGDMENQFIWRVMGGDSDAPPPLGTVTPDVSFSEQVTKFNATQCAVLRVRFQGAVSICFATDPDPTFDVAGTSGSLRLFAADVTPTYRHLQKPVTFRDTVPSTTACRVIGPNDTDSDPQTPRVGLRVTEAAVLLAETASASLSPTNYATTNPQGHQTLSFQLNVEGMTAVSALDHVTTAAPTVVDLEPVGNVHPRFNGYNHLVSRQNAEPMDPFQLAFRSVASPGESHVFLRRRCVGLSFPEMTANQRCSSGRFGFGLPAAPFPLLLPAWSQEHMEEPWRRGLAACQQTGGFLSSFVMAWRSQALMDEVNRLCPAPPRSLPTAPADLAKLVALCERIKRFRPFPNGGLPQPFGLMMAAQVYGHTISGTMDQPPIPPPPGAADTAVSARKRSRSPLPPSASSAVGHGAAGAPAGTLLSRFAEQGDFQVAIQTGNAPWLASYAFCGLDTDAQRCYLSGEVYMPVTLAPVPMSRKPSFPLAVQQAMFAVIEQHMQHQQQQQQQQQQAAGLDIIRMRRTWSFPAEILAALEGFVLSWAAPFWSAGVAWSDANQRALSSYTIWPSIQPTPPLTPPTSFGVLDTRLPLTSLDPPPAAAYVFSSMTTEPGSPPTATAPPVAKAVGFDCLVSMLLVSLVTLPGAASPSAIVCYASAFQPTPAAPNGLLNGIAYVSQLMDGMTAALGSQYQGQLVAF